MYLFFGFYGACRLFESSTSLCTGVDRLAGGLAFFIEGYLFANHVHGRSVLDSKIHMLIVLACYSSAAVWFTSFFVSDKRRVFILDMVNSSLMFAQGTWFWHVAIILYGRHPWPLGAGHSEHDMDMDHHHEATEGGMHDDEHAAGHMEMDEEHMNSMFAVLFFTWHVAFAIVLMATISTAVYCLLKKRGKLDPEIAAQFTGGVESSNQTSSYRKLDDQEYKEASFGETHSPLLADDEEHVLFDQE